MGHSPKMSSVFRNQLFSQFNSKTKYLKVLTMFLYFLLGLINKIANIFEQNIFSNLKILDFGEFLSLSAFQNVRSEPRFNVLNTMFNMKLR